jgi:hypothetical protein
MMMAIMPANLLPARLRRAPATAAHVFAHGFASAGHACGKTWMDRRSFLLNLPAQRSDRRLAAAVVAVSLLIFATTAPFARVQLPAVWGFVPSYTQTAIVHHGRLDPGVLLLAKPYRKIDLARMIRKALDGAATPAAVDRVA